MAIWEAKGSNSQLSVESYGCCLNADDRTRYNCYAATTFHNNRHREKSKSQDGSGYECRVENISEDRATNGCTDCAKVLY